MNSATIETAQGELAFCLQEFPNAWRNQALEQKVYDALIGHGFTDENTLFAHATCPDEVNYDEAQTDLCNIMHDRWGEKFTLGGLAGFPFTGRTGWGAFSAHTPDNGHIVILFAPHVGIGSDGRVGRVRRDGQSEDSTCCGAAVAAYSGDYDPAALLDEFDPTQGIIRCEIGKWKERISADVNPDRALVYANYHAVREYLRSIMSAPEKVCKMLVVLGGIMVNLPAPFEDRFVPLTFQVLDCETGAIEELCEKTFGPRQVPDLMGMESSGPMGKRACEFCVLPLPK